MSDTAKIVETDSTGRVLKTYIVSPQASAEKSGFTITRVDPVDLERRKDASFCTTTLSARLLLRLPLLLSDYVLPVFLPHGYPHTVSPDYTSYQIYDSLQAFASTIAGLLSSRAVLQSLGFDDGLSSTTTATYATLLSIAQATVSNLSTILFAHYASQRIGNDVKFYRFLADIVNDTAFLIDCLSPSLPRDLRAAALCVSSIFRAICGVAGGSSKALLSSHFALTGNVGELNAKDSSQETVIGLIGMWVGGIIVSRVVSTWATWLWMLSLLTLHLWFNYRAVRCIVLKSLNGYRAGRVVGSLHASGQCPGTEEIARGEGLFSATDVLTDGNTAIFGRIKMGVRTTDFLKACRARQQRGSGAWLVRYNTFQSCIHIMREENYLLWYDVETRGAFILLKDQATTTDQLRAWYHATCIGAFVAAGSQVSPSSMLDLIAQTLVQTKVHWTDCQSKMVAAGWDLTRSGTEPQPGSRISIL